MRILPLLFILFHFNLLAQVSFTKTAFNDGPFGSDQNCAVDMNGDLLDDIVALNSKKLQIYYQQADGSFTNKIFAQDLTHMPDWSICAGDIDANGYNDLAIGGIEGVSFLYANNNGSDYREEVKPDYIFSQRTSFADINNDGHLDAFVCNDIDENHPFRNDGNGNLTLDFNMLKTPTGLAGNYTTTWVDYDNDDDLDLHIAKCVQRGSILHEGRINLLYNNDGNSNYTEVAASAGLADNDQSWVTLFEDYDNDGDFDAITFNHETSNRFMKNNGDGTFTDIASTIGISPNSLGTFEALAADFDNDGNIDIITDSPAAIYYGNGDFTFTSTASDIPASALADFNSDGFIDVLQRNEIFYNQGNNNHWLRVNTIGTESNRNAIGARLELYGSWGKQIREVRVTQSWSPMSTLATHFGIGNATSIDSLVVKWPSGNRSVIVNPGIDQALVVDESDCPYQNLSLTVETTPMLCQGEVATLTAPAGYSSYAWSNGATSQMIEVASGGFYNVTVTDSNQCSSFSTLVQIYDVDDVYEITAPQGIEFCEGGSAVLELDVPFDVEWSNGRTDNFTYVFESGIYSANIISDCDTDPFIEPVIITEHILEPLVLQDVLLDTTQEFLFVTLPDDTNPIPDGLNLLWWDAPVGGSTPFDGSNFFFSELLSDTTFYISYFQIFGNNVECHSERTSMTVVPTGGEKRIVLNTDPYLCQGETVTLIAPTGYSYLWSTGDTSGSVIVETAGTYSVTITDIDGNEDELSEVEVYLENVLQPEVSDIYVAQNQPSVLIELEEDSLAWWDAPEGGNLIYVGRTLEHFVNEAEFTYYIERQSSNGNGELCTSARVPLTIFLTSSVSEKEVDKDITVFPNPNIGLFTVKIENSTAIRNIKVKDLNNRVVYTQSQGFDTQMQIVLEDISAGIYLLELNFRDKSITKKIIVQN